ncbi:MAG TPA: NAD(P)/FAD-dependent oxidoreductase [Candidatus Binataceae bacterium]|nr:NAD(P)/FAD-dependent oxidoreductase [Candidatus Binataceae bacterium]
MGATPSVVVLGAGLGGLCVGAQLKKAGFDDFVILEKASKVGGTWRENTYPGCACDTPVAVYQFSFAKTLNWSHLFPRAAEVQRYTEDLADLCGLRPHLRLGQSGASATWDDARARWRITTTTSEIREAQAVVMALGQLNRPQLPDIPGRDSFAGPSFHSAQWNHAVDLTGKRVGVIGSAASAIQLIPEVAKIASHLEVFQRTPNWILPRLDREVTEAEKKVLATAPEVPLSEREHLYLVSDVLFWKAFEYTEEGRAFYTEMALNHLKMQVPDPELRRKLTPGYPIGCKRVLFADDYYPALMQPNVSLVTEGVDRIVPEGVVTKDGVTHRLDVLVHATGFETTGWHWSVDVTGRGGLKLREAWKNGPEAYLGITVTNFPNLFMIYGPNTNLGHNTITFMIERQTEYILKCLEAMRARNLASIEVSKAAQDRFNRELQARLAKTTWADPRCSSWYKTAEGHITQNWAGHTREYRERTREVAWADYVVGSGEESAARAAK